jgi:large subunit ribosomal protein L5
MTDKKKTQYTPALKQKYRDNVVAGMMERFNYTNIMEVPRISHISINMGIGDAKDHPKKLESAIRGNRMYEFLERLISIALPRTRDFRGLSFKSFDGSGNYTFGVKEQIIFTEINYDKIDSIRGMDISFTTTAKTNDEAYWLLKLTGLPLRDKPVKQEEVIEAA